MAEKITPGQATQLANTLMERYLKNASERDFKPYVELIFEGLRRSMNLVSQAGDTDKETAAEILRSVIVLNHAYLEDFLRNVALWLLPLAGEEALNEIPLSGNGRAEKFSLGKLAHHRGKSVDSLIRESVAGYMERSTFNNVTDVMSFLKSVGVTIPRENDSSTTSPPQLPVTDEVLSHVESMMQRRHQIVHRGDRIRDRGLQEISEGEVLTWLVATLNFTLSLATENFARRHSFEEFREKVRRLAKDDNPSARSE